MKKLLLIPILALLFYYISLIANSTSLEKITAKTKTMRDLDASLICEPHNKTMQCIDKSSSLVEDIFDNFDVNITEYNTPSITYIFENNSKITNSCSYNIDNSKLKKCPQDSKLKMLTLNANNLSGEQLSKITSAIQNKAQNSKKHKFIQGNIQYQNIIATTSNNVSIELISQYNKNNQNNALNVTINYYKNQ